MGLYKSLGNENFPPTRWGCKLQSNVNPALGRTGSPQNEIIVVVVVVVVECYCFFTIIIDGAPGLPRRVLACARCLLL